MENELTIKEEVTTLLERFVYEHNNPETRDKIKRMLIVYFDAKLPRERFTFTDVSDDEAINNGRFKFMVKTGYINAGQDGNMTLEQFLTFITDLAHRKELSKRYVLHVMDLSCYIRETLRVQGKTWDDLNKVFDRDDCKVWIGGGASNLTMRDLSILEIELDINLVRNYSRKELGLERDGRN